MATYDPMAPLEEILKTLNETTDHSLIKEIITLIDNRFQNLENMLKTSERSRAALEEKVDSLTPQVLCKPHTIEYPLFPPS